MSIQRTSFRHRHRQPEATVLPRRVPRRSSERGQILIIFAGGATALLLLVGLVIDGGIAVFNRRDGQNVSDLAALAGAKEMADAYTGKKLLANAHAAISASVTANDCTAGGSVPCSWQAWYVGPGTTGPVDVAPVTAGSAMPPGSLGVRVAVTRSPGTFLARLANISAWTVSTQATAIAWEPRHAPGGTLLPIAMKLDPLGYEPGQVYDITDGKDAPGGFGYISWTGSNSAGSLATSLCTPDNPSFSLPATFPTDPGTTNADAVRACLSGWVTSGQMVQIPLYSTVTGTGNGATYQIVAIATFVVTAVDQPAIDNIRGYFVEIYPFTDPVPGGLGTIPPTTASTSFALALVR